MNTITIHPKTDKNLAPLRKQLPHALLLTGERGTGLTTIARSLAGGNLASFVEPVDSKEVVNQETGTISIASIRKLYEETRAKHTSPQVFILDSADRMSTGAQAAFLKLLEEPTESSHFILTSHTPQALLSTVRSRVQTVAVEPITDQQTSSFIETLGVTDSQKKRQLLYLASGLPAELRRLTGSEDYFKERAEIMMDTRTLLSGSTYEKLLIVQKYHQNREKTLQLVDSALLVTKRSLIAKPQSTLVAQLDLLLKTRENISANYNARLQLAAFVI